MMEIQALAASNQSQSLMGDLITKVLSQNTEMVAEQAAQLAQQNMQAQMNLQKAASIEGLGALLDVVA